MNRTACLVKQLCANISTCLCNASAFCEDELDLAVPTLARKLSVVKPSGQYQSMTEIFRKFSRTRGERRLSMIFGVNRLANFASKQMFLAVDSGDTHDIQPAHRSVSRLTIESRVAVAIPADRQALK